jgi:DNA mismatch repair protein MutS
MSPSGRDTPMMRHYLEIKAQHPNAIVLYRMGDFYELFLEDAELAAPLLELTLTTRDKGKVDAIPMCGFPVHSADGYVRRLAELGQRVAICEQVEDARAAGGRRLVRREVVEVVTPGLVGDPEGLEAFREVSLVALAAVSDGRGGLAQLGIAVLDATTGDFRATEIERDDAGEDGIAALGLEELERISPREILLPAGADDALDRLRPRLEQVLPDAAITPLASVCFEPDSVPVRPSGLAELGHGAAARAAAALLAYLAKNQPAALTHVPRLRGYQLAETMVIDAATRAHLELFENGVDRGRARTLVEQVDLSATALGARRLARWLGYPLLEPRAIRARHDAVAWLAERDRLRAELRGNLADVRDLERILSKAVRPGAVPRDLGRLRASLQALPAVAEVLGRASGAACDQESLLAPPAAGGVSELPQGLTPPEPVCELEKLLEEGLIDDPPVVARGSRGANATGYIREGFRAELDALRESAGKGREWIAGLETQERDRTGIATLKVRYHPVHGYSLEVTKSQLSRVPEHYERKQTLANVERFTTPELSEMQGRVMGAHERAAELERAVFESLREAVVAEAQRIRAAAERVADIDALASLAEVARRRKWVRPSIDTGTRLEIRAGRHPVVEAVLTRGGADGFVPNDTVLAADEIQILLLTGPNMSGKSTYLRQVALITLLAQAGSFVPADSARIGIVDRIFTRVGASDRLSRGESTFMVEMRETAEILRQASGRSLIILDEIGRGTSTFDGLSIAWAVAEYLHDTPGLAARTLFATHYHELTDLARTKLRVSNAHFDAREWKDEVVFLRRLVAGGANRSYGIQVARLAGLPDAVIARSREILRNLEEGELTAEGLPRIAGVGSELAAGNAQLSLGLSDSERALVAHEREVIDELRGLDPDQITPMDALLALRRLAGRLHTDSGGGESC